MKILLLLLMLISPSVYADWDSTDYALGAAAVSTLVVDWGQTRYIVKNPQKYSETNPILGEHPSMGRTNLYFLGAITGTLLLANWLEPSNRKWFLGTVTAVELVVIGRNKNIGIGVSF